jgi:hypothetical protein
MTGERRTLSDADITSSRSTPRVLRRELLSPGGGEAARSLRGGAPAHDTDGASGPRQNGAAARPGADRD